MGTGGSLGYKGKKKKRKDAVAIPETAITLAGTKIRHEIDEKNYPS